MPFFSVIIPVYNIEEFIEECVNSILSQIFEDYEAIRKELEYCSPDLAKKEEII